MAFNFAKVKPAPTSGWRDAYLESLKSTDMAYRLTLELCAMLAKLGKPQPEIEAEIRELIRRNDEMLRHHGAG